MEKDVQQLIDAGQQEDSVIVHAALGEMVVPPVISEQTQQMINQDMQSVGLNPAEYMIGQGSVNNLTGLQEFGFLSKLFKKVKKVVKKVAPIAVSFIPGIGPVAKGALTAVAGKASGLDTKEALLGGLTAGVGAKFLGSGATGKGLSGLKGTSGRFFGKEGTFRNILGRGRDLITSGLGGQQPIMPEGDFTMVSGGQQDYEVNPIVTELYKTGEITYQQGFDGMPGFFTNKKGDKFYSPEQVEAAYAQAPSTSSSRFNIFGGTPGQSRLGLIEDILKGKKSDPVRSDGSFFGINTPGPIKGIEDVLKGQQTGDSRGGLAALAALYGLATKKAAEKTEGGLRDIRLSTRPDLLPQQTFQGFDVGIRPGMSYGGGMGFNELDMRMGGPSVGPGTETSDDIPAMLSDGEFVMTAAANKGLGGFKIEKNKDSLTIFPTGKPDREQGFKNNDKLMKFFEGYQDMMS